MAVPAAEQRFDVSVHRLYGVSVRRVFQLPTNLN